MKLYLPISSQNFNNIFSTESVSPHTFYSQRNFGIKRHFKTEFSLFDEYILFYPVPIYFRLDNGMAEAYPLILVVDNQSLNLDLAVEIETRSGVVLAYPKSIYLNMIDFEIWFHNQHEKDNVIARAEAGLEVKAVNKYKKRFKVVNPKDLKEFDVSQIKSKSVQPNLILFNEIKKDKSFNHFKGLVLGYLVGRIGQKSKSEIEFAKSLQEIINNFANMKSGFGISDLSKTDRPNVTRLDTRGKRGSKNTIVDYDNKYSSSLTIDKQRLLENTLISIDKAETLFSEMFGNRVKTEDEVLSYLKTKSTKQIKEADLEVFIDVLKSLPEFYDFVFKSAMKNKSNSEVEAFEFLRFAVNQYAANSKSIAYSTYEADEEIKNVIYKLEKYSEAQIITKQKQNQVPDLTCFIYDIANQLQIQYDKFGSQSLPTKEIQIYEEIARVLLEFPKTQTGEVDSQEILDIVAEVGRRVKSITGVGMHEVQNLRDLYGYLQNKLDRFDAERLNSIVISNFASFVFKPNSIEELQKFVEIKGIKESYIAFSFWSAFNGFASLSKTFTQTVFTSEKSQLGDNLDVFLSQILKNDKIPFGASESFELPAPQPGFIGSLFKKTEIESKVKKNTTKKSKK